MKVFALIVEVEKDYEDIIDAIIDSNILDMSVLGYNIEFKSEFPKSSFVNIYSEDENGSIKNISTIKNALSKIDDIKLKCGYKIEELDSEKYLYLYKDFLKPFSVCNLNVIPNEKDETTAKIKEPKIYVSKQYAFGTGTHDTTSLALKMLYKHIVNEKNISGLSFADVGCGSGILSLAAYVLGIRDITAVDNDIEAVFCTRENFLYNSFNITEDKIFEGSANCLSNKNMKYDIVVANIETDILIDIMQDLVLILKDLAFLILSGILIEKKDSMYENIAKYDFLEIVSEDRTDEWMSIVLKNKKNTKVLHR